MEELHANRTSRLERSFEDRAELKKRQEWEKCVAHCVQDRNDPKDELVCARICV